MKGIDFSSVLMKSTGGRPSINPFIHFINLGTPHFLWSVFIITTQKLWSEFQK